MYKLPTIINSHSFTAPTTLPWGNVVSKCLLEKKLRRHEILFFEGDDAQYIYGIVEGALCNSRILSDGRRQVLSFPYPGDLVGLGHSTNYHFSCTAISDVRVRVLRQSSLHKDNKYREKIERSLLQFANNSLVEMQEHQMLLGRKSALEKVAAFLLRLARRQRYHKGEEIQFILPMKRLDIADFLGLTAETVCRKITRLRVKRVIDLSQATTVTVLNIQKLEAIAETPDDAFGTSYH